MNTDASKPSMGDATTISVPEDLADELYERKGRGETYADVIRRLLEAEESSPMPSMGDGLPAGEAEETRRATPQADEEEPPAGSLDALVDDVGAEVLPGSGAKLEDRREAFAAVVEYLREHGDATPAELQSEVYPEHRGRYTTGEDPPNSWWKNAMYPALRELAERTDAVEKADEAGTWSYVDGEE